MTQTADKYISKSGRLAGYDEKAIKDDIFQVSLFLAWAEDETFAGVEGKDAFRAFCRIHDIDTRELRRILKGE